jgi:hypothetical protein
MGALLFRFPVDAIEILFLNLFPFLIKMKHSVAFIQLGEVQKLITLKEGRSDETKLSGTLAPFRLRAPWELMEVGV